MARTALRRVPRSESFLDRVHAVAVLGRVPERDGAPDLERLAEGRNHRALTPALEVLLGIL